MARLQHGALFDKALSNCLSRDQKQATIVGYVLSINLKVCERERDSKLVKSVKLIHSKGRSESKAYLIEPIILGTRASTKHEQSIVIECYLMPISTSRYMVKISRFVKLSPFFGI